MNEVHGTGLDMFSAEVAGQNQFNPMKFWRTYELDTRDFRKWRHRAAF